MPSELWGSRASSLLFADAAQAEDRILTLTNLGISAGRVSTQHDLGTGSTHALFLVQMHCSLSGTNVVGAAVEMYAFCADASYVAGGVSNIDVAFATDKRNNGKPIGNLVVDQTTTNTVMTSDAFLVLIPTRYFSIGVFNATTLTFTSSTANHGVLVTPWSWESQ